VLEDAAGNGDADGDEDQAAEEFAPLPGLTPHSRDWPGGPGAPPSRSKTHAPGRGDGRECAPGAAVVMKVSLVVSQRWRSVRRGR